MPTVDAHDASVSLAKRDGEWVITDGGVEGRRA